MEVLNLVVPVFLVMLTGTFCRVFNFFGKDSADLLVRFALFIAIPALMFGSVAKEPVLKLFDWPYIASFGGGSVLVFLLLIIGGKIFSKLSVAELALDALAGSMSNAGFVALPILLALFGQKAAIPAAISLIFVSVFLFPLCIIILEFSLSKEKNPLIILATIAKRILTNPMVLPTLLGILYSLSGLTVPVMLDNFLSIMAAALTPCALFAIGLEIDVKMLKAHVGEIFVLSFAKLILLPIVVGLLAWHYHLSPLFTIAAILSASVPTAKTAYVLANYYHTSEESVAATISATTVFSMFTMFVLLLILAHQWPAVFQTSL